MRRLRPLGRVTVFYSQPGCPIDAVGRSKAALRPTQSSALATATSKTGHSNGSFTHDV